MGKNCLIITLLLFSITFVKTVNAQNFVHPGLPYTINDLERMKANRIDVAPWDDAWDIILATDEASLDYEMQGPTEDVENGGNDDLYIDDVTAMLYHALQYYFTGDEAHAELAISMIEAWASTHKTWSGTSAHLGAAWRGGTMAQACEILRYTYPGWTDDLTVLTEDYFLEVFWPLFRLPDPLRAANQGANNLMGAMYVAVYCNDQEKFDICIKAFLNDACGGISNTLPNGECGDTGRDQGHAMGMIGNLATVCEIAWAQGIDLYSVLDNRLLTVHEYWCDYNLGNDVDWIDYGTCYGYYTSIGSDGREAASSDAIPVTEMIYGGYTVRKGMESPYVTEYRSGLETDENTFLYRKDSTYLTTASFTYEPYCDLATSDVTSLTSEDVGSVGVSGSSSYSDATWTLNGSGDDLNTSGSDAYHFAYTQLNGDGSFIAKVTAVENTSSSAKASIVLRETLSDDASSMAAVSETPESGSDFTSRGWDAADGDGEQSFSLATLPMWLKVERRDSFIVAYVGPDGETWAPMQNTVYPTMSDDYYIGLGVCSNDNSNLCTSNFINVQYGYDSGEERESDVYSQIEAEDYTDMYGIETETTSDESGDENVMSIDDGDWMEYELYVPYSGNYTMKYRVAAEAGGDLMITVDEDTLEQYSFAATGGVDEWETVESGETLYFTKGTQTVKITANSGDWKINWMRLIIECKDVPIVSYVETIDDLEVSSGDVLSSDVTVFPGYTAILKPSASTDGSWSWTGPNEFTSDADEITFEDIEKDKSGDYVVTFINDCGLVNTDTFTINVLDSLYFEAESYNSMDGVSIETTDDESGVSDLTGIDSGDWMSYDIDVPISALYYINYRISSESGGGFTTSINGEEVEQVTFDACEWTTVVSSSLIYLEEGSQTLLITSSSDGWELNWIELEAQQTVSECSLPYQDAGFRAYMDTVTWTSGAMDITCETGVSLHAVVKAEGIFGDNDHMSISYKLDGGEQIPLVEITEATELEMFSTEELSASTLEIIVESEASSVGYFLLSDLYVLQAGDPFEKIQAEDYDSKSGGCVEDCSDTDGGESVGCLTDGNYLVFNDINLSEVYSVSARLAHKNSDEGTIEVRLDSEDGDLVGTINVPNTGGWQTWETVTADIEATVGFYDVYLVFSHPSSYVCNINWFQFSEEVLTSVNAIEDANTIIAYPNPVGNILIIEGSEGAKLELFNSSGVKVLGDQVESDKYTVSMNGISSGIYILRLTQDSTTKSIKLIKQ
jgi:hypothetical protein